MATLPLPDDFTITTARCLLRQPTRGDIPDIFEATRTPGFNDGMMWEPPATPDDLLAPLADSLAFWRSGSMYVFAIEHRESHNFLGRIAIRSDTAPDAGKDLWNIGFFMHPRHQGQGYMREAAQAILRFGFDALRVNEIEAFHATWNKDSEKVLQAIGMIYRSHHPQGFMKRGEWVPENRLSITREMHERMIASHPPHRAESDRR